MPFFDEKRYKNGSETDTPFYNLQIKYKLTYLTRSKLDFD